MAFQDHFSRQSEVYAKARPTYPDELFEYLAGLAPSRQLCWDCATGNGQAASSLAKYFEKVIATDGSQQQIKNAMLRDNIEYRVATAEESGLPDRSADLITAATAAHYFNHDKFYHEALRVSKANGILAVWTYSEAMLTPEIDEILDWFMYDLLHDYWPDARWYLKAKYTTLPFPFNAIKSPPFYSRARWTKARFFDYVKSWSAYNSYVVKNSTDPLQYLMPKLSPLWDDGEVKPVTWPLHLKCARLNEPV